MENVMPTFDVDSCRALMPFFNCTADSTLIYADNAATTQKPLSVIQAELSYYQQQNANVHRGAHQLSQQATALYEQTRDKVAEFINANRREEIIFTQGTTAAINLLATTLGEGLLTAGDTIVLSFAEHHANIVPWQQVAQKYQANIKVLPLTSDGIVDIHHLEDIINVGTKIVAIQHIGNVIGKVNPIDIVINRAKQVGALSIIDGAQAVAHVPVDVQQLNCDFYVFSAHKMFGPTGVGVLYGKYELLETLPVYQTGGEMIKRVSFEQTTFNELPYKFEPGTPNIAGVIGFSAAIDWLLAQQHYQAFSYEKQLTHYTYTQLQQIPELQLIVEKAPYIPLFAFTIEGMHHQDVASALDAKNIAVRAGHHCAMPLMQYLKLAGCVRLSLSFYNTFAEVDCIVATLKQIIHAHNSVTNHTDNFQKNADELNHRIEHTPVLVDFPHTADSVTALFLSCRSWEQRHRQLMLLSKTLPRLDPTERVAEFLIQGCESDAWLITKKINDKFYFYADSDAKLIRGLLVVVIAAFYGQSSAQINTFDLQHYFAQLGLSQQLSPSRVNGLNAIVEQIYRSVANLS
jgi:SufS family cysteine desulfurase